MKKLFKLIAVIGFALSMGLVTASAGAKGSKDEAVAMVKKAVEYIKANGADKAYAEISNPNGQFKDRDLYVVVDDITGKCLAHGANAKQVGKDLSGTQDADGKYYVKERIELTKSKGTFWQNYKSSDPVSKQISPKETYCERLNDTAVCVGVYQ